MTLSFRATDRKRTAGHLKAQVQALEDAAVVYVDSINLDKASDRERYARDLKTRLNGHTPPPDELHARLLRLYEIASEPSSDGIPSIDEAHNISRPGKRPLTELGNAERMVDLHGADFRYCWPHRRDYTYVGTRWATDTAGCVTALAKRAVRNIFLEAAQAPTADDAKELAAHAVRSESDRAIQAMLRLARSEPGIPVQPHDLDADPWLFNVENGTLDLRTGTLRPHNRADLITKIAPVRFDPAATAPTFERFLQDIFPGKPDIIRYLQRRAGYSLTGFATEQEIAICYGLGANGKSTLFGVLQKLAGDYGLQADMALFTVQKNPGIRNDLARLDGVRLLTASETEAGSRLAESLIKAMTGGDPIVARYLYGEFFQFLPKFTPWLAVNHRPEIRGTDHAIWRRVRLIPFSTTIPPERQDPHLAEKLAAELPGILNWALEGCREWQRDGLRPPAEVMAATAAYRLEQDTLAGFLAECCITAPRAVVAAADLRTAYERYCEANGEQPLNAKQLGMRLTERGYVRERLGGAQRWHWRGLGLRTPDPDTDNGPADPTDPSDPSDPKNQESSYAPPREGTYGKNGSDGSDGSVSGAAAAASNTKKAAADPAPAAQTDPSPAADPANAPKWQQITAVSDLAAAISALKTADFVGLDIETAPAVGEKPGDRSALDPRRGRIRLVQLAGPAGTFVIDARYLDPLPWLRELFRGDGPVIVGHNLAFDLGFLRAAKVEPPTAARLFDTQIAAQLLGASGDQAERGAYTLATVAAQYCGQALDKTEQRSDWDAAVLAPAQLAYAARDAAVLLPLQAALAAALDQAALVEVMALEMETLPALIWMEAAGAPFDTAAWAALSDAAVLDQQRLEQELTEIAGVGARDLFGGSTVNWQSAPQVLAILQARGHNVTRTDAATLASLPDDPLVAALLAHRDATKRASTYGIAWAAKHVHPVTNRVHADYQQLGAVSGRMSCTRPNLQNIPHIKAYRACFAAPAGRVLIKADYSQIELRIAAAITKDQPMLAAFRTGQDLHTKTAAAVLGKPLADVTKADRQLAKALNFGLLYGMGVASLQDYARTNYGVTLTEDEAARHRAAFFKAYPALRRWHDRFRAEKDATDTRTLLGRRRRAVAKFTEKLNTPVQGTGADILKMALARLWADRAACPSAVLVATVHDEIVLEADAETATAAAEWLRGHMEAAARAVLPDVPVAVETTIAPTWAGPEV